MIRAQVAYACEALSSSFLTIGPRLRGTFWNGAEVLIPALEGPRPTANEELVAFAARRQRCPPVPKAQLR
eukprot:7040159-Alexandrium_andersonii.AAC.1